MTQGRSGRVRKISPQPEFDPRTFQPVANLYTDYNELINKYLNVFTEFVKSIDFTKLQQTSHYAVKYELEHAALLCNAACCEYSYYKKNPLITRGTL